MSRLINADALRQDMYHEAFETDSEMQKWDSGCWIRYKMFEQQIDKQPTIDAVPVVHGHWIYKWNPYFKQELPYCSVCEKVSPSVSKTDYCSHCGAVMDEYAPLPDSDDIYE